MHSKTNRKSTLTPAKKKFAEVYAKTDNATQSVKIAFKANNYTDGTAKVKGHRLLANDNVSAEIERQKQRMEIIAGKAVQKIERLIDESDDKTAAHLSTWAYEQVHGKALSKNISLNATTTIEDALAELN